MTPDNNIEKQQSQMRKGMLEFCTLLVISSGPVYASDILNKLKDADLLVVEGTLYPLLSRLRSSELVDYTWSESKSGPPRKYYTLTTKGKQTLKTLRITWDHLSASAAALITKHSHEKNN